MTEDSLIGAFIERSLGEILVYANEHVFPVTFWVQLNPKSYQLMPVYRPKAGSTCRHKSFKIVKSHP